MIKTDKKGNIVACLTTKEDLDYSNFDKQTIDYYDNFLIPSYEDEIERLKSIIKEVREYIENNTYKIEWGDLEQDNEDININEDLTEKEFIEGLLEILEGDKDIKL